MAFSLVIAWLALNGIAPDIAVPVADGPFQYVIVTSPAGTNCKKSIARYFPSPGAAITVLSPDAVKFTAVFSKVS